MKWCIRAWSTEFQKYLYMTTVWISHGSVCITSDETVDRISYDSLEIAQRIIDGWKSHGKDEAFWKIAKPFEYKPLDMGPEWKFKSRQLES